MFYSRRFLLYPPEIDDQNHMQNSRQSDGFVVSTVAFFIIELNLVLLTIGLLTVHYLFQIICDFYTR